jgi:hypothetical protein
MFCREEVGVSFVALVVLPFSPFNTSLKLRIFPQLLGLTIPSHSDAHKLTVDKETVDYDVSSGFVRCEKQI